MPRSILVPLVLTLVIFQLFVAAIVPVMAENQSIRNNQSVTANTTLNGTPAESQGASGNSFGNTWIWQSFIFLILISITYNYWRAVHRRDAAAPPAHREQPAQQSQASPEGDQDKKEQEKRDKYEAVKV